MSVSVFIDGAVGTTGLEIRERLAGRADIQLITLDEDRRKDAAARAEALNAADFVILCLPDDAAREAVALIDNPHTRVIDASTAHRIADGWTYGFPELEPGQTAAIAEAMRVSNPGCYPTGFLALVRPLVRAGLVPVDWPITVNAVSGYSGGGKSMIAEFEGANPPPAARAYALGLAHKHVPEMQKHARIEHPPIFAPSVANTYRGMIVEVPLPLHLFVRRPTPALCETVLREAYQGIAPGKGRRRRCGDDRDRRRCGDGPAHLARVRQPGYGPGAADRHARQPRQGRRRCRRPEPQHHGGLRSRRRAHLVTPARR